MNIVVKCLDTIRPMPIGVSINGSYPMIHGHDYSAVCEMNGCERCEDLAEFNRQSRGL